MLYEYLEEEYKIYYALTEEERESLEHVNCCEKILFGANNIYNLGLDNNALKIARGFGGGMNVESTCGVITGGVMALSNIFYESTNYKEIIEDFVQTFIKYNGSIDCDILKKLYRTEDESCKSVILKAAVVFDEIVDKYKEM